MRKQGPLCTWEHLLVHTHLLMCVCAYSGTQIGTQKQKHTLAPPPFSPPTTHTHTHIHTHLHIHNHTHTHMHTGGRASRPHLVISYCWLASRHGRSQQHTKEQWKGARRSSSSSRSISCCRTRPASTATAATAVVQSPPGHKPYHTATAALESPYNLNLGSTEAVDPNGAFNPLYDTTTTSSPCASNASPVQRTPPPNPDVGGRGPAFHLHGLSDVPCPPSQPTKVGGGARASEHKCDDICVC